MSTDTLFPGVYVCQTPDEIAGKIVERARPNTRGVILMHLLDAQDVFHILQERARLQKVVKMPYLKATFENGAEVFHASDVDKVMTMILDFAIVNDRYANNQHVQEKLFIRCNRGRR